jgi:CHAT domain-containing protein
MIHIRLRCLPLLLALQLVVVSAAAAQSWKHFDVPDSLLAGALRTSGRGFESAWNALLVAELRASLAHQPAAASLGALESRVAAAEGGALGSTIASDALTLRRRWSAGEQRLRLAAWDAESLGVDANDARAYSAAESLYRAALERYRKLAEKRRGAWLLGSLGVNAYDAGDFALADSFYTQALAARRALGDRRMIGASLNALGSTRLQLGRPAEAYGYIVAARAVRESLGDERALAATLNALATAQGELGRPDSARATFALALAHASAAADSSTVQNTLTNLARLCLESGDAGSCIAYAMRALPIARESGDASGIALLEMHLGMAHAHEGRFADAGDHLEIALGTALAIGDARGELQALVQQGRLGVQLQDSRVARPPLERAVTLADSLGDRVNGTNALNNLAIVCRLEGDSTRARSLAERAIDDGAAAGDSAAVRGAAVTLGQLATDRGDANAATACFARAAAALAHPALDQQVSDAINLGASSSNLGRLDEAERRFRDAEGRARAAGATELLWPAWLGLGDVAEKRGHYADALAWDRRAASLIDTLRSQQGSEGTSIVLLSRRLFAFEALIHLLGKLAPQYPDSGYDAEAFGWAERVRARAFLDLLNARGLTARRVAPVSLDQARAALPSDHAALLEYSLGDSSSSLWVVTRNSWLRLPLPPAPVLRWRAEILRSSLGDPVTAESRAARSAARALYRLLIAPAEPALMGVDQLIVAPDGALSRIPFEALLAADAPADAAAPANAYLIERYQVSYVPSATAFCAARSAAAPTPPVRKGARSGAAAGASSVATAVVAIGAPEFGPMPPRGLKRPLPPLPSTLDELAALQQIAGAARCQVVSGRAARRDTLLALALRTSAGVFHVATHGEANEALPERSGLWLSAASDSVPPDFVSLDDLLALRMRAGLVTLSACETGAGRLERGEGVVGLARALMAAGARSVVVSLWSVNDASTASLMRAFYTPLLTGGESRTQALAEAKRALIRSDATRSPFHWAPFVLIGASGRLD